MHALRDLRLCAMGLTDADVRVSLLPALRRGELPCLCRLSLDRNFLRRSVASIVTTWTSRKTGGNTVEALEVGYNSMGNPTLEHVLHALRDQTEIRYLGLGCIAWDEPRADVPLARACAALMTRNPRLRELIVECNNLGLPALRAILLAAREHPGVRYLDLCDNFRALDEAHPLITAMPAHILLEVGGGYLWTHE